MFLMGVAGQISALLSIKGMRDQFFCVEMAQKSVS
jgi:hypothetical protein